MRKLILEEGDYLKGELGHGHERSDRRTDGRSYPYGLSRFTHCAHGARAQGPAPQGGPAPPSNYKNL